MKNDIPFPGEGERQIPVEERKGNSVFGQRGGLNLFAPKGEKEYSWQEGYLSAKRGEGGGIH